MKVLELFAGKRSIGKAFEKRGHEVYSIDWSRDFDDIDWYVDINEVNRSSILERFGQPDVIWASPDCTTYSVAAISRHRRKDVDNLTAVSEYAKFCDNTNIHLLSLIESLYPVIFYIENPRGALRKMNFMKDVPLYTVTYCQYGDERMKPTDIWTNHPYPNFKPICKNGDVCHVPAPRGSPTGTQGIKGKADKSLIPSDLCDYIVKISEDMVK